MLSLFPSLLLPAGAVWEHSGQPRHAPYRRREIDFTEQMRNARGAAVDDPAPGLPQEIGIAGLPGRPGHNGRVDRESMLFAESQARFRVGAFPKGFDPAVDKLLAMPLALMKFRRRSSTEDAPYEKNIAAPASLQK
jgi:hypothetical protein